MIDAWSLNFILPAVLHNCDRAYSLWGCGAGSIVPFVAVLGGIFIALLIGCGIWWLHLRKKD